MPGLFGDTPDVFSTLFRVFLIESANFFDESMTRKNPGTSLALMPQAFNLLPRFGKKFQIIERLASSKSSFSFSLS